jgi:hypothetical protein
VIARIYLFIYVSYACAAFYKSKKKSEEKGGKEARNNIVSKTEIDI